jgi:signal transduction histidine kinase
VRERLARPAAGALLLGRSRRDPGRHAGIGIERELLSRLFEPFVQAERSLARTQGGLGLGLALVRGICELHGGTVHVQTGGSGHGTEFVVHLPLASSG